MSQSFTYYQKKNINELLSISQTNLKDLKHINKKLKTSIQKFKSQEPSFEELQKLDKSWKKGYQILKNLKNLSEAANTKPPSKHIETLTKMNSQISLLKTEYEDSLNEIKSFNYVDTERRSSLLDEERRTEDLQEQLNVEEVIDQESLIKDRNQNIVDINNCIKEVKAISNQIFAVTRDDGEKLDNILKKQEQHLNVVTNKVNVDLIITEEYQGKMCRNSLIILGVFFLIALTILSIYYIKVYGNN